MRLLVLLAIAATPAFADDVPDLTTARHLSERAAWGWAGLALAFLALCVAVAARRRPNDGPG